MESERLQRQFVVNGQMESLIKLTIADLKLMRRETKSVARGSEFHAAAGELNRLDMV